MRKTPHAFSSGYPLVLLALVMVLVGLSVMPVAAHGVGSIQEGWFSVLHWTPQPGSTTIAKNRYSLTFDDGHILELDLSPQMLAAAGGLQALKGQRVAVTLSSADSQRMVPSGAVITPTGLRIVAKPAGMERMGFEPQVSGAQPWVTILCNFPGTPVGQDTDTLSYFQTMYSASYPGMDHYWREQSFNTVTLAGSQAFGFFTLPKTQVQYIGAGNIGNGNYFMSYEQLQTLFTDCTNAANPSVNFANFKGINMMFNGTLDCCAWGGQMPATLDGVFDYWSVTWNPPWSWRDITVVAHEVGHGFGLPHSNNYDNDPSPYDNPWDVMSNTWFKCGVVDHPSYGCLGQHTNAYHKDSLGWFGSKHKVIANGNTSPITLDHIVMQNPDDYQIIVVPINNSANFFYTVEARQTTDAGYDLKLPGKAVNIYEVNTSRQEPAWLVGGISDSASQSVTTGLDGAWLVGETFSGNGITISVVSMTSDGFVVQVTNDDNGVVAPNQLEAVAVSGSQINLAWDDNSGDETGYRVERSPNGTSSWAEIASLAANSTTFSNTGLACNTQYHYRVRAARSSTFSNYAKKAAATTLGSPCGGDIIPTATNTPTATATPTNTATPVAGIELVVNGGMETDSDLNGIPENWVAKNAAGDKIKCNTATKIRAHNGACAFMFRGGAGENTSLTQKIDLSGVSLGAGSSLSLYGFFNGSNAATNAKFSLLVTYADGTKDKVEVMVDVTSGYEYHSADYTLLSGDITKLRVRVRNSAAAGKLYADDLSLVLNE